MDMTEREMLEFLVNEVRKINLTLENEIRPQMQTLAEGVGAINDKLVTRSEMESVKEELAFLKDIIRMHTTQINDLRKAQ